MGQTCQFGESVLVKIQTEKSKNKFFARWVPGDWLGKTELNDTHMVSTTQGVVFSRSVRRRPGTPFDGARIGKFMAKPWALNVPLTGHEIYENVVKQPVIVPVPPPVAAPPPL